MPGYKKDIVTVKYHKVAHISGRVLNRYWNLGAQHPLYCAAGKWYHPLKDFPGVLCDLHGYVWFETEKEYREEIARGYINEGVRVNVPNSISAMSIYKRVQERPLTEGILDLGSE